jgi:hypothetical protein
MFTQSSRVPIIQLKPSVISRTYTDFYGDISGTSLRTDSGQTLADWLTTNSIATAYVNIWYDQSWRVNEYPSIYNATAAGTAGIILNTSTIPWSVESGAPGGGYFTLPSGTIVGNGTCTCSCKINLSTSSTSAHGIIGAAGDNSGMQRNSIHYTVSGSSGSSGIRYTFASDWGSNSLHTLSIDNPRKPLVMTLITHPQGSAQGTYYTGGTPDATYTQKMFLNKTTTSTVNRSILTFSPGNDQLMSNPYTGQGGLPNVSPSPLGSQMFYCINSGYAITEDDRTIMENS